MSSKLKYLVIDSGAFIQKQPLWNYAEELYSVPEVLTEIKDPQTRQFVDSFPVEIKYCQPQPSSLAFITEFSKKSGDYHVLSITDLKLLALTYELEVQENGSSHLRLEPLKKVTNITVTVPVSATSDGSEQNDSSDDCDSNEPIEECQEDEEVEEHNMSDGKLSDNENSDDGWTTISKRKPKKFTPQPSQNIDTASITSSARDKLGAMCLELLQTLEVHFTELSYVGGHLPCPHLEVGVFALMRCILAHMVSTSHEETALSMLQSSDEEALVPLISGALCFLNDPSSTSLENFWQDARKSSLFPNLSKNSVGTKFLHEYPSIRRWVYHISTYPWLTNISLLPSYTSETKQSHATEGLVSSLLVSAESHLVQPRPKPTYTRNASVFEDDDDDDDQGWITPDNIDQMTSKGWYPIDDQDVEEEEENGNVSVTVACITVDYAMQHVLKHIKLGVLGIDGRLIGELRNFVLRCFSCFKVTPDMSHLFCPKCGHKTLKRVSITTNADGTQNIWISRRRLNTRGFRYNLPKPRGGQHALMPLLTADQRFPHQMARKCKMVDPLHADYIAGPSPFSARDINSRAALHGYHPGAHVGGNSHPTIKHAKIWKPKRKKITRK